jgi:hypothetical protein
LFKKYLCVARGFFKEIFSSPSQEETINTMAIVSAVPLDYKGGKIEEKDKKTVHHIKMKFGDVHELQFLV